MTLILTYTFCALLFLTIDLGASAPAIQSESNEPLTDSVIRGQTPSYIKEESNTDRRLVQQYVPPAPGSNQFEGYSCSSNKDCFNHGRCMNTEYGGAICNCTESWMGPQCEFPSSEMGEQLHDRPLVEFMFFSCLNSTGLDAHVRALSVFHRCNPGNCECWIQRGGANAIKVLFWCLNTGYRMLLSEAIAKEDARWGDSPEEENVPPKSSSISSKPALRAKKKARSRSAAASVAAKKTRDMSDPDYYGSLFADKSESSKMP